MGLLLLPAVHLAQTTGGIDGRVTDAAGTPLQGVTVEATSPSLPGARVSVTGRDGAYRLPAVPPGAYRVIASLSAFRPVEKACTVSLGSTATVDLTLRLETEEEIVVSGEAPHIDQRSTTTGTSYTSAVINRLPVARNYADIVSANPGVSNDPNSYSDGGVLTLSIYGATSEENQWIVDGVTTTQVRFGVQGKVFNNEFVQEVEVMTGGYSAEYGRALGGIVNAITKSGGNEFHGDGFVYYDSTGTAAQKQFKPGDSGFGTWRVVDGQQFDYGFDLGGFLMKDRLWFFGAYNRTSFQSRIARQQATTHVSTADLFPLDAASNYYSGKLTWNAAPSTTVVGSVFGDPTTKTGATGVAPVNPDPSTWWSALALGGTDFGIRLSQLFGPSIMTIVQGAYHEDQSALTPPDGIRYNDFTCSGGTPDNRCAFPLEANNIYGGYGFVSTFYNSDSSRKQITFGSSLVSGEHDVKAGGDYMNGQTQSRQFRTGGQQVFIYNEYGQLYYQHRFFATNPADPTVIPSANSQAQVLDYSAYLQDSWKPAPNLTVNVGLRWDGEESRNYAGETVLRFNVWQPRIGLVWDPWRNGATKIYASAGRFSYAVPTFTVLWLFGSWPYNMYTYNFDPVGVTQDPNVINHGRAVVVGPAAGPYGTPVDTGIRGAYQDEVTIGLERLLLPTLTVGVKGTYRSFGNALHNRCDFDYTSPELNGSQCVLINPGSNGRFSSGNAPVCNGLWDNPDWYQCSPTGPPTPPARRYYRGIELLARQTLGQEAWLQASYVYSSLRGNENYPVGIFAAFDYPALWHDAYGLLELDRTNRFRLDGYWVTPWHLSVGLQAFAETGAPLSKLGYFNGFWGASVFLTPQGSEGRLPTLWGANLTLGYPMQIGPVTVTLQAYLYNVFNKQIAILKDEGWTTSPPEGFPENIYDPNQPQNNPDYGKVTARSTPRLFRAALRVSF